MKAILFDLDGVFYEGDRAIEGGAQTIAWARAQQIPHLYLTNTTSKDRAALVRKLTQMGVAATVDDILTPPVAAAAWLRAHAVGPVALFVPDGALGSFVGLPQWHPGDAAAPAALVVGDLGEGWRYALLNSIFRLLMQEPPPLLLALGMTRYWRAADGLRLDVAPFIAALEHASGVRSLVLGKPSAAFYQTALELLGVQAEDALIVGDDIRSDIDGAQRCGLRGLLVRTGKYRQQDLDGDIHPYAVLDSIAALPDWWRRHAG